MSPEPRLSIVVPFYNEQQSITPLHAAIAAAVTPLGVPFEMVFVDDGSRDRTFEVGVELARTDSRVRVVKFRRNYGQTAAMAAGIEYARGEIIITMDGDLQNDPADIGSFLAKMDEGYDIVVGWRFNRQDKLISRKIPSRIANRLIAKVTGVPIRDNGCSLKAYRAVLIKKIPLYSEMHRFIPAVASIAGPRIAEIKVNHHARQFGQSKYGLSRVYKVLLDLLVIKTVTTFTSKPLLWFSLLALLPLFAAGIALTWSFYSMVFDGQPLSLPVAGSGLIFLSSACIVASHGALGELIYKLSGFTQHEFLGLTNKVFASASGPKRESQT
ncbi:MAG: glycosyltransferase family 2 protein [Gammaproteobacteria bacterium]